MIEQQPDNPPWSRARADALHRSRSMCEAQLPGCDGRAFDVHHKLPRGRGGLNTPDNLIALCRRCHDWIERHPEAAREWGFTIPSGPTRKRVLFQRRPK